jgi:hypothetical protein
MGRPRKIKKSTHQAALDRMADLIIMTEKKPRPYAVSRSVLGRNATKSETDKLARDFCEFEDQLLEAARRRRAAAKSQAHVDQQIHAMKRENVEAYRLASFDPVKAALRDRPEVWMEYQRQEALIKYQKGREDPLTAALRETDGF